MREVRSVNGTQALLDAKMLLDQVELALHMDAHELLRYHLRGSLLAEVDGIYSEAWA